MPSIFKYYNVKAIVEDYVFTPQCELFDETDEEEIEEEEAVDETDDLEDEEETEETEDEESEEEEAEETDDGFLDESGEKEPKKVKAEPKHRRMPEKEIEAMIAEAERQAKAILNEAKQEAENLKKEAYKAGYEQGSQEGYETAHMEQQQLLEEETNQFMTELEAIIADVEQRKVELLQKYRKDMKNIAIAVGEKVIQISLKTSGDVIERMIESATEKLKRKEWMKIYIAKCDADMLMEGDSQLMRNLNHISKHVKLIVMENETPGTCIIELPDEIIDASAQTQVENIKEILNNASM